MKFSRRKKVKRYMTFFKNQFGFREPYQLLIDGPFCLAALENKVNIKDQMPKYFNCEVKLLTTQCVLLELEKLGPSLYGALNIVKQFPVHKCGHEKNPIPAAKCLESMITNGNPSRYILVSQDPKMREVAREIAGTPILYLYGQAPTLEKPSTYNEHQAQKKDEIRVKKSEYQLEKLKMLKAKELGTQVQEKRPRKKKAKGPNPLSCKKKQKKTTPSVGMKRPADSDSSEPVKKRRKRLKIAAHVRQELLQK